LTADVEVRDLSKVYPATVAVDHVNFQVEQGEFYSLLGPSGCGKTTTLRMIAGFVEPTAGEIRLRGTVVNELPPFKRNIGMVFQNLALFPHMNVRDNLAFGLKMKKFAGEEFEPRVKKVLDVVELPGFEDRRIGQLSGGQMQRIALARALITDPTVLLLDEPLGALDLKLRLQLQVELKQLQRRVGTTFIFVTHDQGEALTMSHRIAIMSGGRIMQIGNALEIYERPNNKFVADFIGETNLLGGKCMSPDRVSCESFELAVAAGDELVGKSVLVSIRPEKITAGKKLVQPLENKFEGLVEENFFKGSFMVYKIRVAENTRLTINVPNVDADSRFQPGEQVLVGWDRDASVVVRE
jgi:ABC-type Fe3+/spermidine/putrescine transport system ATPase subunit